MLVILRSFLPIVICLSVACKSGFIVVSAVVSFNVQINCLLLYLYIVLLFQIVHQNRYSNYLHKLSPFFVSGQLCPAGESNSCVAFPAWAKYPHQQIFTPFSSTVIISSSIASPGISLVSTIFLPSSSRSVVSFFDLFSL